MSSLSPSHFFDRRTNVLPHRSRRAEPSHISTPPSKTPPPLSATPSSNVGKSWDRYFSSGLKLVGLLAAVPVGYLYRQPLGSALYKAWNLLGGFKEIVPLPEPTPQPPPSQKLAGFFQSLCSQGKTVVLSIGGILGLGAVAGVALRKRDNRVFEQQNQRADEEATQTQEEMARKMVRRNEINEHLKFWQNQQTSWQSSSAENRRAMLDEIQRKITNLENERTQLD